MNANVVAAWSNNEYGRNTSLWLEAGRRFRGHHLAMVGSVILVAMVLAVLAGPLVWRYPINEIDFKAKLKGPSWSHPLGTDDLGRHVGVRRQLLEGIAGGEGQDREQDGADPGEHRNQDQDLAKKVFRHPRGRGGRAPCYACLDQ
ncbi:MAG: hypothetical protein DME05_27620 [Candidatus Rokuibacteriota bacterium]|nr:MAG: hypothetical protein DME05_27620 [Candidatus Rokubacteria bacterium]